MKLYDNTHFSPERVMLEQQLVIIKKQKKVKDLSNISKIITYYPHDEMESTKNERVRIRELKKDLKKQKKYERNTSKMIDL